VAEGPTGETINFCLRMFANKPTQEHGELVPAGHIITFPNTGRTTCWAAPPLDSCRSATVLD
jgi:hypothetical protein